MTEFKNPSVVELSVFRGVAGCLWSNVINDGRKPIAVFLLLKVPHILASAYKKLILLMFLHSVWIGSFLLGLGIIGFGDGQSLR